MEDIQNINFLFIEPTKELISQANGANKSNFMVAEFNNSLDSSFLNHLKQGSLVIMIIIRGNIQVTFDQQTHLIEENTIIRAIPEHFLQIGKPSNDFLGKAICVNRNLLDLTTTGFSPTAYLYFRQNAVFKLAGKETEEILELFRLIKKKAKSNFTHSEEKVFHCLVMAFFYELTGCINRLMEEQPIGKISHKENLYKKFIILLRDNIKEEHSVTYYANQLCLTPQYISSVLKELSGMTANKWIDEMLLAEAKQLLFSTENTIQQIADKLHFPDQSTFGKFFKKMTGLSPSHYKKNKTAY